MFTRFADPWWLIGLLGVPLLVVWHYRFRDRRGAAIQFSYLGIVAGSASRTAMRGQNLIFALRMLGLTALVIALARPQTGVTGEEVLTQGIDIMLVLDLSSSMLAEDIEPNRLEAAKAVASEFVAGRLHDRIGLVVFAGEAFTQSPLTLDYGIIGNLMGELEVGAIEDGTAIGMGIATAVKRLEASNAASKVMIVLTDGRNNRGQIDPATAAEMAQAFGIRIYTIGAGNRGEARVPVDDPMFGRRYVRMNVDIDEETLTQTAQITGGQYFRATDRESLASIYERIDSLETTEIEVHNFTRYGELFHIPLGLALAMVALEMVMANTKFRRIP